MVYGTQITIVIGVINQLSYRLGAPLCTHVLQVSPRAAALGDALGEAFALALGAVPPQSTK